RLTRDVREAPARACGDLHGYVHPGHEWRCADARAAGRRPPSARLRVGVCAPRTADAPRFNPGWSVRSGRTGACTGVGSLCRPPNGEAPTSALASWPTAYCIVTLRRGFRAVILTRH